MRIHKIQNAAALIAPSYQCCSCDTVYASAIGLPVGWSQTAGAVWCPDCTSAGIPAQRADQRQRSAA